MNYSPPATREAGREVGRILDRLLADEHLFDLIARDYQRNATGPDAVVFRGQFQQQHEKAAGWIAGIAAWTDELQLGPLDSWPRLKSAARGSAPPGAGLPVRRMGEELLRWHAKLVAQLRTDIAVCLGQPDEAGTTGFLIRLQEEHELAAAMLRFQIEVFGAGSAREKNGTPRLISRGPACYLPAGCRLTTTVWRVRPW